MAIVALKCIALAEVGSTPPPAGSMDLAWLLPFDERHARRKQRADAAIRASTRAERSSIRSVILPADGTSAANWRER
jgi:hypothetical protein